MRNPEHRKNSTDEGFFSAESKQGAQQIQDLLLHEKGAAENKLREFITKKNKAEFTKQKNGTSLLLERVFASDLSDIEKRITHAISVIINSKHGALEAFRYMNGISPETSLQALAYMTLESAAETVLGVKSRLGGDVTKTKHPLT